MLKDYFWLQAIWQQMLNYYRCQQLPHVFLLVGNCQLSLQHLLERKAQLLLCEQAQASVACGHCQACRYFLQHAHPDYHDLSAADADLSIDGIRALIDALHYHAHHSGRKVIRFDLNKVGPAGSHALLKLLEEPPSDTIFLLQATQLDNILLTLKSRCVILTLANPRTEDAVQWLQEQAVPAADARRYLQLAHGAPLQALALSQDPALLKSLRDLENIFAEPDSVLSNALESFVRQHTETALYLFYYWLHAFIQTNDYCSARAKVGLLFIDQVHQALRDNKIVGINKILLFETLRQKWYRATIGS